MSAQKSGPIRAMNSLVEGTPEWLRAKDIFDYVPPPHMRNRD